MHQSKYTGDVLKKFKMEECNVATTPAKTSLALSLKDERKFNATMFRQMVGSLRYLCNTRHHN